RRSSDLAVIDEALEADTNFAMGHIFRGLVNLTLWESSAVAEIETSLARLDDLHGQSNDRERMHGDALRAWASGDWNGMRGRLDQLLAEYPRDLLALQVGHQADFFAGDRDNLRGRVERALPAWSADDSAYGYLLGMHSFGLEECGAYAEAEDAGRRALDRDATDCWAQHAVAHVLEMQARQAEGVAFMEDRAEHWAQADNGFCFHNWWHTAIYNLDQGNAARALEIYDQGIRPEPFDIQLTMLDAVALLWRMRLRDMDVGDRWDELAATYENTGEDGFYAFNDMHAMMAYTATGRGAAAEQLLKAVEDKANASGTAAMIAREVGVPIVRAVDAFGRADYDTAVELLMSVRYRAHLFGGSHAQRDIVHRTLIEAAIKSGNGALAQALTNERVAQRPDCPYSRSLQSRAQA
ncbi:MAG: tetratricopeptide repeat protein, partial [Alphaproteobacteria bacterium]